MILGLAVCRLVALIPGFWLILIMRIHRYPFVLFAVISFPLMSGSNLILGLSVSVAEFVKSIDNRNKKKQPRGLTLTGRLWFGLTGCSKFITSAMRVAAPWFCYHVTRDTLFLGSLISPSISQLTISTSASNSLISSFFESTNLLKFGQVRQCVVNKITLPILHFPSVWCEWKRNGSVPEHALLTNKVKHLVLLLYTCWHAGLDLTSFLHWSSG